MRRYARWPRRCYPLVRHFKHVLQRLRFTHVTNDDDDISLLVKAANDKRKC